MLYVYMDESGDLGFGPGASKHFVIALMLTNDRDGLRRIIKFVRKKKLKRLKSELKELKWNTTSDELKEVIFDRIAREKLAILTIVLNKNKVRDYLRKKKDKLYNYICGQIFLKMNFTIPENEKCITMIVDKRSGKKVIRQDFDNYIKNKLRLLGDLEIVVSHFDSHNDECLQVVDFICGAIFTKYERGNTVFYDKIRGSISFETKIWECNDLTNMARLTDEKPKKA